MAGALPVLINRSGGTAASLGDRLEQTVRDAFAMTGREIALELLDGPDMREAVRRNARSPVVVVGGGDGTLSGAAQVLAGKRTALGVLPLGTRNHLARQLGLPVDLTEAVKAAAGGERRRIDLGRAGERVFVNNASLGIYNKLVVERERTRLPKRLATVPAAWRVLRTMRPHVYCLTIDGERRTLSTPLLFIGNNRYSLDPGHLGERESLEDGVLSVCAVAARGPLQLIWLALKVLFGLAHPERDFAELDTAREIVVEGDDEVTVALDGELARLSRPLRIAIDPGALGIVAPRVAASQPHAVSRTH
jgi:diacylglycerol kinase family enzyme